MDVHRIAGDDELATQYARTVIKDNITPDGHELSPMRVSECRITLGFVAGREGDLEQAVELGVSGLKDGRQSKMHLQMIAGELDQELRHRFPSEGLVTDFEEALHGLQALTVVPTSRRDALSRSRSCRPRASVSHAP
jgi:hypothetical protein